MREEETRLLYEFARPRISWNKLLPISAKKGIDPKLKRKKDILK